MDRLKKNLRCKFFLGFVVIVLFLFLFFSLMDTTLRFNHYIKYLAVKTKQKGPMGLFPKQPLGCLESDADFRQIILRASLSSPLFPREVDPDDFSPCIKQETIITVEFIFF